MSEWKHIYVHKTMVQYETGNAMLFAMPSNSRYRKYCTWISKKTIKLTPDRKMYIISYKDDFTFALRKYSKDGNRDLISEIEIGSEEFAEIFD